MIKNKNKKMAFFVISVVVCMSTCFLTACKTSNKEDTEIELVHDEEDNSFITATAEYGEIVQSAKIDCEYTSTEHQDLAFMVDDKLIERVDVKKGDIVSKGDLLAAVDLADLEDTIAELEYQISVQELELTHTKEIKEYYINRAKNEYKPNEMTMEELAVWEKELQDNLQDIEEQYHDTIQDLEDSIVLDKKRLTKYKQEFKGGQIIAGISGEITYINESMEYTYSEKETKVMTISNLDSCYFIADDVTYADYFKENEIYSVVYKENKVETHVDVTPVNCGEWQNQMCFKPVNGEIFENGHDGTIYIELDRKSDVLCVPNKAIHEAEDGTFVYILENDVLSMRYVEVGIKGSDETEAINGLEQGEQVVLK